MGWLRGTGFQPVVHRLSSRSLEFVHLPGAVILSHQAKDLAAAFFAAVICPLPRCSAGQKKSLSTQRAKRDPSDTLQDDG
jgi:hypothetical protein